MSRPKTEINPERAERVKILMKRENIKQNILAERIYQTQQNVSRILQKRQPLTEETAKLIVKAFPQYRLSWLLCYDNYMTVDDVKAAYQEQFHAINRATATILDNAVKEVCHREGIEPIVIDNIPEFLLLEAQLKDFASSLIWNYIHRKDSQVWTLLDHEP